MNFKETVALTEAIYKTGEVLHWHSDKIADKHYETYVVSDTYSEAERLFLKHNELQQIEKMELVSTNVINQWAQ